MWFVFRSSDFPDSQIKRAQTDRTRLWTHPNHALTNLLKVLGRFPHTFRLSLTVGIKESVNEKNLWNPPAPVLRSWEKTVAAQREFRRNIRTDWM